MLPSWAKTMARELVVPWSRARMTELMVVVSGECNASLSHAPRLRQERIRDAWTCIKQVPWRGGVAASLTAPKTIIFLADSFTDFCHGQSAPQPMKASFIISVASGALLLLIAAPAEAAVLYSVEDLGTVNGAIRSEAR